MNLPPAVPIPEFLAPPVDIIQDIRMDDGSEAYKLIPHMIINPSSAKENGYVLVDSATASRRLEACMKCEFAASNGFYGICKKCGCDIETKARMESEKCPIDRWDNLEEDAGNNAETVGTPGIAKMASTFLSSTMRWAKSGMQTVTAEQFYSRVEICKGCEFWEGSGFGGTGRCKKCGCSTQAKLRMATEKCPIDKW